MTEEKKFDVSQPFKIKHLGASGIEVLEIQFPSDADWIERETRRKDIIEFESTGEARTTRDDPDAEESELVKKLCPGLEDVDPYEAGRLLDQLGAAFAVNEDSVVEGNRLTVKLKVFQAVTTHAFRIPQSKELEKFNAGWVIQKRIDKKQVSSTKNLKLAQQLYAAMIEETPGGYSGVEGSVIVVPIIHQAAAVYTAFGALQAALDDNRNP